MPLGELQAASICGVKVGVGQGCGPEGCLGGLPTPFGGVAFRGHGQYTLFLLLASSEVAMGFFGLFVSRVHNLPSCTRTQLLFLVPYNFFVFCCSRRHLSGTSTASKGPLSQVPASVGPFYFKIPPPVHWGSSFSRSSPTLVVFCFFIFIVATLVRLTQFYREVLSNIHGYHNFR